MYFLEYPFPLFGSTLMLIFWGYFSKRNLWSDLWRTLFFGLFILYGVSMFWLPISIEDKMAMIFRDLLLMAGTATIFQAFLNKQASFVVGLFFLISAMAWLKQMDWFFPSNYNSALDKEGELLVELSPGKSAQDLMDALQINKISIDRAFQPRSGEITDLDDYFVIDIKDNSLKSLELLKSALSRIDFVDWVEENESINVAPLEAEEKKIDSKFGINDPGVGYLWGFNAMEVDRLYNYVRENRLKIQKQAVIAILDTGIDGAHEDLKEHYVSTRKNYDRDVRMHGTHCAGIAAAVSNNGVGVASMSPSKGYVKVTSIKVLSDGGFGTQQTIIKGMIEAADLGVDVISMSLGGKSNQLKQTAYRRAVSYANAKGAIVVVAAGNSRMDAKNYAPVNTPGVIGVSAIDDQLRKADFSNYVNRIPMALAAPGVNIYSTTPSNNYQAFSGTSMATPYVAGLVGLMKSLRPDLNTETTYDILNKTGLRTPDGEATGNLIQPYLAIKTLMEQ